MRENGFYALFSDPVLSDNFISLEVEFYVLAHTDFFFYYCNLKTPWELLALKYNNQTKASQGPGP